MKHFDLLIVGTGHAGAQAAIALRQLNFGGSIALLGKETELPYQRPPLSKDYLAGELRFERMLIRPASYWANHEITLLLGHEALAVDPEAHILSCAGGETVGYRSLIWATGGTPRRLACDGGELAGVHIVRSRADVDLIREELGAVGRAVVIGGGYIGLEAAAVLGELGKQVVLLEAEGRTLPRVAGEPLSRFFEAEHRARGVDVRLGATVDCIGGENGRASAVRLVGGESLPAQLVVVGIGIVPAVEPLRAAGAAGSDGVDVDAWCRTSLPDIYAVGDCAAHINRFAGGARIRLESVQNAHDQANIAARDIVGQPQPYDTVPWFWSNQYDLRLQTVGLSAGHDELVVRGSPSARSFSVIYLSGGRVIALDCVNATRDYVQGRRLIEAGSAISADRLADASVPLKELI